MKKEKRQLRYPGLKAGSIYGTVIFFIIPLIDTLTSENPNFISSLLNTKHIFKPQLCTPNLKTIQNPCLSLDPGWFLFSPNGCFLLDKKEFPLYGISVEKNTKRKET
ncbi:TPA: hypothetical protein ACLX4N_001929, partial [Streptococcus pneumoniae]